MSIQPPRDAHPLTQKALRKYAIDPDIVPEDGLHADTYDTFVIGKLGHRVIDWTTRYPVRESHAYPSIGARDEILAAYAEDRKVNPRGLGA
jgi:hypothetical protein